MASHPTLPEHFTKAAQSFPDKWALPVGKFEISHSCLQELIAVLRSAGISPDDVVVLPFPNSIEAQAAASKLGITLVTVSLSNPSGPVHISVPTLNGDSTHGLVHDFSNDASDGVLIFNNSGTTSRPKVIALTQHNLVAVVQSIPSVCRMTDSDSTVVVLPLFYVHGLQAGLLPPLSTGGSVTQASLGQFSASTFWGDMHKPGSVDKPVGQELVVLDDKGVLQLTGVTGEVCIRWPNVTKGYKNNPGHLEYLNEDGYLHLVGQVKELINNGCSFQVERITLDVGVPISVPALDVGVPISVPALDVRVPINVELEVPEVDLEVGLGNQTSLPASGEQNTFHIEGIAGPDPLSVPNGSNGIWHLRFITACNFVSNATVGVLYLGEKLQGCNDTYQRAELIASVGAPIAVAAGTFVASILFASNPERWSKWISGMSIINAAMTVGGPLSFNWVRN